MNQPPYGAYGNGGGYGPPPGYGNPPPRPGFSGSGGGGGGFNGDGQGMSPSDESTLKTLSVLYYVYAGFIGLMALGFLGFILIFFVIGAAAGAATKDPAGILVGAFGAVVFGGVALLLIIKAIVLIMAGSAISKRTSHTLVTVAAILSCFNMPLGLVLGIITLTTISKPAVKRCFGA